MLFSIRATLLKRLFLRLFSHEGNATSLLHVQLKQIYARCQASVPLQTMGARRESCKQAHSDRSHARRLFGVWYVCFPDQACAWDATYKLFSLRNAKSSGALASGDDYSTVTVTGKFLMVCSSRVQKPFQLFSPVTVWRTPGRKFPLNLPMDPALPFFSIHFLCLYLIAT